MAAASAPAVTRYPEYRARLKCSVAEVDTIFDDCMSEALRLLSPAAVNAYLDGASAVNGLGRGTELVVIFLQNLPETAALAGEEVIDEAVAMAQTLSRSANARAINPFLSSLPGCARRLAEPSLMHDWFFLVRRLNDEAGQEALVPFLSRAGSLLEQVSLGGVRQWIETGLAGCRNQPHRLGDWFSLQSPDSRAALQRERHGTLFVDHERQIRLYQRAFWDETVEMHPYSEAFDTLRKPRPHLDRKGIHLPDVYEDLDGVRGIDRYRALVAHLMAHRLFSRPVIADNFSPFQQLAVEYFEDVRVELLMSSRFPGLRRLWLSLHPRPEEGACPEDHSCIRHQLTMLSRALLDPEHGYRDPLLLDFIGRFREEMAKDPYDQGLSGRLGVAWLAKAHTPAFRQPRIWFRDTEVSYRDDNRYLWQFLEDTEDEDEFHSDHNAANPRAEEEEGVVFSRHFSEWDYRARNYQPDWVTLYESIHPAGDAARIDALLERHRPLAKRLKRIVEFLKPQQHTRVRYQSEGDDLDLDLAVRAVIDQRSGLTPDPRILMSHRHDGRDITVLLLVDLSESINEVPTGAEHSILQLSQEAVSLLAWAIDALGDNFAIAGFASNTRHEVRYLHLKGFGEKWGELPKARLAAMQGGLSTRMGAVLRNGGEYLSRQKAEKRLLLLLTDGEPHDIDSPDPRYLIDDTRVAVAELAACGVDTHCITLDPHADDYVADIFGNGGYTVVDHVERLPEKLPQLFMALTK